MSDPVIPFWYTKLGSQESEAVAHAIESGRLSQGSLTEKFESELARLLGVSDVVATVNGTTALFLAAVGLGITQGDEVILPDRTFVATANAMLLAGARVKLVDVRRAKALIDPERIAAAITNKTKAIVPVHLNGNAADMPAIKEIAAANNLLVIEDAAQAFGSQSERAFLGTESHAGCFSLGVTKFITTGQGGFVATSDREVAERMRRFRTHGVPNTFEATYERFGFNLRFTDIQAAIGLCQLQKVPQKIVRHKQVHAFYAERLAGLPFVQVCPVDDRPGCVPLWTEALVADRDRVIAHLAEANIQVRPFLPNLHDSAYLGDFAHADFPNAALFAKHGVFLPSGPDVPDAWLERVCAEFARLGPRLAGAALPFEAMPASPIPVAVTSGAFAGAQSRR